MADQTIHPAAALAALAAAVEKLKSYTFKPGIESTLFRLKGPEVAALLAAASVEDRAPAKVDFVWSVVGTNNDHAKLYLELNDDYVVEVFNSYEDGLWVMILNKSGHRRIESEAAAKAKAEELIRADIAKRLVAARRAIELYGDAA